MTKRNEISHVLNRLTAAGISEDDANALRRISMTLRRWYERECGDDHCCIERDEVTGKPYVFNAMSGRRSPCADLEAGAEKRLNALMDNYPQFVAYRQTDPRGAALYMVDRKHLAGGASVDSVYTSGIAVY